MNTNAMADLKGRAKEAADERDRYIAEIARLRARPTEEQIWDILHRYRRHEIATADEAATIILALFPKVQP